MLLARAVVPGDTNIDPSTSHATPDPQCLQMRASGLIASRQKGHSPRCESSRGMRWERQCLHLDSRSRVDRLPAMWASRFFGRFGHHSPPFEQGWRSGQRRTGSTHRTDRRVDFPSMSRRALTSHQHPQRTRFTADGRSGFSVHPPCIRGLRRHPRDIGRRSPRAEAGLYAGRQVGVIGLCRAH
jgi:hypothetical protein